MVYDQSDPLVFFFFFTIALIIYPETPWCAPCSCGFRPIAHDSSSLSDFNHRLFPPSK